MTDVRNRGSMLDRYPCLLFLPLEVQRSCMSANDVEEMQGFPLIPHGVHAAGSGGGAAEAGMHCRCIAESCTLYAIAECLPVDHPTYGDSSIICCLLWLFHFN